jgi:hypothetical protein
MGKILWLEVILIFCFFSIDSFGQDSETYSNNPHAVTTYECAGIYWKTEESDLCSIRYRELKSASWQEAMPLVYDTRDREYRGSVVNLKPDTEYDAELVKGSLKNHIKFRTRNDHFPVGKTTVI